VLERSKTKALVFLTKRGEKPFSEGHRVPPFYRERFDWEYLQDLLEASRKEKLKFERAWIIRISKNSKSLVEVRQSLGRMLSDERKLRGIDRNVYTVLAAYLDKILPVLAEAKQKFSETLTLRPGINVMDLREWYVHEEVQMLVIRSCMEHILKEENNVIVALPEAWKMLPQSRNTPVKLYFEKFIREGATNGNYLFIDAQDLGGVDKTPLRQVDNWIMGRMKEANEVERLIKQTLGLKVPAREIQTLPLGHFMVAAGSTVQKVYVWPHGVPEGMAKAVASGAVMPEVVKDYMTKMREGKEAGILNDKGITNTLQVQETEITRLQDAALDLKVRVDATNKRLDACVKNDGWLKNEILELKEDVGFLEKKIEDFRTIAETITSKTFGQHANNVEASLQQTIFNVKLTPAAKDFKITDENMDGKVMTLCHEGFLKEFHSEAEIRRKIREKGWAVTANITLYNALQRLVKSGFLGKMKKGSMKYKLAPNVRFIE